MDNNIINQLSTLREKRGYTQEFVAERLDLSRQSYIAVEKGERKLNTDELEILANLFGVPVQEFFNAPRDENKFKQMYFYVLTCLGKEQGVPKTKLAKLLYLIDFRNFYENLESMSGVQYLRRQYGPLADVFLELTDDMQCNGEITIDTLDGGAQMIIKSTTYQPDESLLSHREKQMIREICELWRDKSTKEIVHYTHSQKPWMACRDGEIIPYSLITQEEPDHVFTPVA